MSGLFHVYFSLFAELTFPVCCSTIALRIKETTPVPIDRNSCSFNDAASYQEASQRPLHYKDLVTVYLTSSSQCKSFFFQVQNLFFGKVGC